MSARAKRGRVAARAGVAAALVAVGVGIVWFAGRGAPAAESIAELGRAAAASGETDEPALRAAAELDQGPTREVVVEPEPTDEVTEDASDVSEKSPEPVVAISGSLVVTRSDGTLLPPQDGEIVLSIRERGSWRPVEVPVRRGRWTAAIETPYAIESVKAHRASSAAGALVVEKPLPEWAPADEIEVRARWREPLVLRVLDAETGQDLREVTLVRFTGTSRLAQHPGVDGSGLVVAHDVASPIALDALSHELAGLRDTLHVGAKGRAWARMPLHFDDGGAHWVLLQPSAELEVRVVGLGERSGKRGVVPRLRVLRDAATSEADRDLTSDGSTTFVGLAPGVVRVRAELVELGWVTKRVLAEAAVELVAGSRAVVELALPPPPPRLELAAVSGRVDVARGWQLPRVELVLELLDAPLEGSATSMNVVAVPVSSARVGYDSFAWRHEGVQVGRCRIVVANTPGSIELDVPSGGRDDVEIVLPPPVELRVHVVDDAGEPTVAEVLWGTSESGHPIGTGPSASEHLIRCPATAIWLLASAKRTVNPRHRVVVDLADGTREVTLRLHAPCGIELSVVADGAPVLVAGAWKPRVEPVGGAALVWVVPQGSAWRIDAPAPGRYTIELPAIPGLAPVPPQVVEVRPGEFVKHVVELARAR